MPGQPGVLEGRQARQQHAAGFRLVAGEGQRTLEHVARRQHAQLVAELAGAARPVRRELTVEAREGWAAGERLHAVFVLPERHAASPEPPRLGVTLEDQGKGVRIAQLNPGSLAERYGLKAGDRIVELAGRAPGSSAEVSAAIRRQPPGTWLPFKVARKDGEVEIVVRFPPQP